MTSLGSPGTSRSARAGKPQRLTAANAQRRADTLQERLKTRLEELKLERQLAVQPPVLIAAALVLPEGWLRRQRGEEPSTFAADQDAKREVERLAMAAVIAAERALGHAPADVSAENRGYDVESRDEGTGGLRFLEVKGRAAGADIVTLTRNEILCALNAPEAYVLALVEAEAGRARPPVYVRNPFDKEPDADTVSVNYDLRRLLARGGPPA